MNKIYWADISAEVLAFLENEEWVQITQERKSEMLADLRNPENMLAYLRYSKGHDFVNFKIYRPDGINKMAKYSKWVFIPGVAEIIEKDQKLSYKKACKMRM